MDGERESEKSMLSAQLNDDENLTLSSTNRAEIFGVSLYNSLVDP